MVSQHDDEEEGLKSDSIGSSMIRGRWTTLLVAMAMVLVGSVCAIAFTVKGIRNGANEQNQRFRNRASEIVQAVQNTWIEYEIAALWVHQSLRTKTDYSTFEEDRRNFEVLYEYIKSNGINLEFVSFVPNITHDFRASLEKESATYYQQVYPTFEYRGFTGLEEDDPMFPERLSLQPRAQNSFYFPHLLIQPAKGNERYIDFDIYSNLADNHLLHQALSHKAATVSRPLDSGGSLKGNTVLLLHPGIPTDSPNQGLASILVSFAAFIQRVMLEHIVNVSVYIYDMTAGAQLFGGAHCALHEQGVQTTLVNQSDADSVSWEGLVANTPSESLFERDIKVAQQTWKIVVVPHSGSFESNNAFVVVGGVAIALACILIVGCYLSHGVRSRKKQELQHATQAEKTALVIQHAEASLEAERQRTEYLAHEVRNPLAAALAASSFVESACQDDQISEDINVIRSSLNYINDLLRSMLDIGRVTKREMVLHPAPTLLARDVLKPIRSIITKQDNPFEVQVESPEELVIEIDRVRLRQIVLNLAWNSAKYVNQGFIRLSVKTTDTNVEIAVEDSGPGIEKEKYDSLFSQQFQASLDMLFQGSGLGLTLSKGLAELMGGDLVFDSSYDSGVESCPGARFVIQLPLSVISEHKITDLERGTVDDAEGVIGTRTTVRELPKNLSVLLVDDDKILRKMLARSIRRIAPSWEIREADSGETAIALVQEGVVFDLIFMDQYMASSERQMLGTEVVKALRSHGVNAARICGLSANDMSAAFLEVGADHFLLKPFASDMAMLQKDMLQALGLD